ncbi:heparin lyase I family protein [Ereboglobus luteus]|nr:heparin lyase I family protein [Ereboglobus luteus]
MKHRSAQNTARIFAAALAACIGLAVAPQTLAKKPSEQVTIAKKLRDFEGTEKPSQRYIVAKNKFETDRPDAITEVGPGVFRFALRFRKDEWWDGDRGTGSKDRQRAEIKGLGPRQISGETYEYTMTWRTNDTFRCGGRFCHVYQLKATDGDKGAPLIVLTVMPNNRTAAVRYVSGKKGGFTIAREFPWKPGAWQTVSIRIKTSTGNNDKKADGELLISVNGDKYEGKTNIPLYRPDATTYRPKWGLYRGVRANMNIGDDWVEHKDITVRKL